MCGLNGAFGDIGVKEKAVQKPVVVKAVGGQESLATAHKAFFDQGNWTLKDHDLRCVIGHNRYATQGAINEENAHPFVFEDVIGCHNGTVYPYSLNHLDEHNHTRTDSQIIIAELGAGTPVKEVIEFANGAYALVWYDMKKHTLHMCRNKERTLYVVASLNKKTIFWASEMWMLVQALAYVGLTKEYDEVKRVEIDQHLTFSTERHNELHLRVSPAVGGKQKPFRKVTPTNENKGWWGSRVVNGFKNNVTPITKNLPAKVETKETGYVEEY
jgi:glucosamine 6-phosphate synthetase-like amidotransferase/phosphosugar isomerase protein